MPNPGASDLAQEMGSRQDLTRFHWMSMVTSASLTVLLLAMPNACQPAVASVPAKFSTVLAALPCWQSTSKYCKHETAHGVSRNGAAHILKCNEMACVPRSSPGR